MEARITGRHMDVTDAIREHVNSGLDKITNHFGKVLDAEVILDVEKHRHTAEINLDANGLRINSKETSNDMYTSIDAALQKVDRQVKKHKDRIKRHQPRTARESRTYEHRVIEVSQENKDALAQAPEPGHTVVLHETLDMKPMSVEEAALQLDLTDDLFLVFANADTQRVNVIYKHGDGTFGLIEPPD